MLRFLVIAVCSLNVAVLMAQDEVPPRSLGDVSEESRYIYLIGEMLRIDYSEVRCDDDDDSPTTYQSSLGVKYLDVRSDESCPEPTPVEAKGKKRKNDGDGGDDSDSEAVVRHYRILGMRGSPLHCDSKVIIFTNAPPTPIMTACNLPNTFLLRVPIFSPIPYTKIEFGNSLLEGGEIADRLFNCGCDSADDKGCNASIDVSTRGANILVEGEVKCNGIGCDVDILIGMDGQWGEVNCGDLKLRFKLEGNCVKGQYKVRIFGRWTGWNNLGTWCL